MQKGNALANFSDSLRAPENGQKWRDKHIGATPKMLCFIAWRNVWRNPLRSLLTLAVLAGGMTVLIFYGGLMKGMSEQMVAFATEVSTGHLQVHRAAFHDTQDLYATIPWAWLSSLEQRLPNLQFSPRSYASGLASSDHASVGVSIQAVVLEKELKTTRFLKHIREGQFKRPGLPSAAPTPNSLQASMGGGVGLGYQLARQLKLGLGDELVLMTQAMDGSIGHDLYYITAIFKPISPAFDRGGVVMLMSDFEFLMSLSSGFHELVVTTPMPEAVADTATRINTQIAELQQNTPLDALGGKAEVRTWKTLVPMVSEMLELSGAMMFIVGGILAVLAALGTVNTVLMAMHERTHELGILRAIGCGPAMLSWLLLLEVFFLSSLALMVGIVFGLLVTHQFTKSGIDFSGALPEGFDWGGLVFEPVMRVSLDMKIILPAAAFMLAISVTAVIFPVYRMLRRPPVALLS